MFGDGKKANTITFESSQIFIIESSTEGAQYS